MYLLANDTKAVHGIDDRKHGVHGLVLLAAVHDERRKENIMVNEIGLPLYRV